MRVGLYGKLPAKRDFVAIGTTREFLAGWEPWLQASLSASRVALGPDWQKLFLRAPIWRFWLGAEILGQTTLGVFMPSVDGVGRYFPLALFVQAEPGESLPPPELEPHDAWLACAEDVLLSGLAEGATLEDLTQALGTLPMPARATSPATTDDTPSPITHAPDGTLVAAADPASLQPVLAAMRRKDHAGFYASMTFWWTVGGEDFVPLLLARRRMPDPYLFAIMLTGSASESLRERMR